MAKSNQSLRQKFDKHRKDLVELERQKKAYQADPPIALSRAIESLKREIERIEALLAEKEGAQEVQASKAESASLSSFQLLAKKLLESIPLLGPILDVFPDFKERLVRKPGALSLVIVVLIFFCACTAVYYEPLKDFFGAMFKLTSIAMTTPTPTVTATPSPTFTATATPTSTPTLTPSFTPIPPSPTATSIIPPSTLLPTIPLSEEEQKDESDPICYLIGLVIMVVVIVAALGSAQQEEEKRRKKEVEAIKQSFQKRAEQLLKERGGVCNLCLKKAGYSDVPIAEWLKDFGRARPERRGCEMPPHRDLSPRLRHHFEEHHKDTFYQSAKVVYIFSRPSRWKKFRVAMRNWFEWLWSEWIVPFYCGLFSLSS